MFEKLRSKFSLKKIEKKLRLDLQEAVFSKNWQERQKINLKLLWISFVKQEDHIMTRGFGLPIDSQSAGDIRKGEGAYFPENFSVEDPLHDKFAEKIVQDYGGVMANWNAGKYANCFYKPASLLPYPKQYIKKACQYLCSQLNSADANWERPANADEIISNIQSIEIVLPNFIELSESELPTGVRENLEIGSKFGGN